MNAEQVIDRLIAEELDAHTTPDMKRVLRNERVKLQSATVSRNEGGQKAAHIIRLMTRRLRHRSSARPAWTSPSRSNLTSRSEENVAEALSELREGVEA